jgi:DNA-binding CsgD family transcriptional regulator
MSRAPGASRLPWPAVRCSGSPASRRAGGASPRRDQRYAAFELTTREADVLPVVAGVLTDEEIAARLYLSARTVEGILTGDGAPARVAAGISASGFVGHQVKLGGPRPLTAGSAETMRPAVDGLQPWPPSHARGSGPRDAARHELCGRGRLRTARPNAGFGGQSGSGGAGGGNGATPAQNGGDGAGLQGCLGGAASANTNPRFGRYLCDRLRVLSSATLTAKATA